MIDWKKELHQGTRDFSNENRDGGEFIVHVISGNVAGAIFQRAASGDIESQALASSLLRWFDMANAASKDGTFPGCTSCGRKITRGNVFGFVVFVPAGKDATGLCGVFCERCKHLGTEAIARNTLAHLSSELGEAEIRRSELH